MNAKRTPKTLIGWQEWCNLPDLNLPAIKAKVDTGAKTSALHAYDIKTYVDDSGVDMLRFKIHPLQRNNKLETVCTAPYVDRREVTSSNGEREDRYVIKTNIGLGPLIFETEMTLTCRRTMAFRMLLGRNALRKGRFLVDPGKALMLGKQPSPENLYNSLIAEKEGIS